MEGYRARSEPRRAPRRRVDFTEPPVNERFRSYSRQPKARFRAEDSRSARWPTDEGLSLGGYHNHPKPRANDYLPTTARFRATGRDLRINGDQHGYHSNDYDYLPINLDRFQKNRYTSDHFTQKQRQNTFPMEFTNSEFKRSRQRKKRSLTRKYTRSLPPTNRYVPTSEEAYYRDFDDPQRKQNNIDYVQSRTVNEDREYNVRMDQSEYDEYVHEEDDFGAPEHQKAQNISYRDMYLDSTRSSLTRGRDSNSFNNRANRDTNNNTFYSRDKHFYNTKRDRGKRRLPRNKDTRGGVRQRYFDRPTNEKLKSNYTPAPPRLKTAIKLLYDLIRIVYHLSKITTKVTNNMPRSFKRLTQHLIDTIKPAVPNKRVLQLLEGNARNWTYNTQQILEEHYNSKIDQTITELKERTNQTDWLRAFEIASGWARKNFRNKIDSELLDRAEALLAAEVPSDNGNHRNEVIQQPTINSTPRGTYAQAVIGETQAVVRPRTGVQHVNVQIQTSPKRKSHGDGWSTPPPNRGEWSFDQDFPPLDPPPMTRTSPVVAPPRPLEPLPPRHSRRGVTELLVDTALIAPPTEQTEPQLIQIDPEINVQNQNNEVTAETDTNNKVITEVQQNVERPKKQTDKRTGKAVPSLTRVETSPLVFSEESDDSNRYLFAQQSESPLRPYQTSLTQFLQENEEEIRAMTEAPDTEPAPLEISLDSQSPERDPDTSRSVGRPSRHINTARKLTDWSLTLKKKYIIVGDSNVARIPAFSVPDLQVDSFPGAKFQHAGNLMERATVAVEPEILIFSFGINNRTQRGLVSTNKEIQRTYRMARSRLPHTELYFPLINFSDQLPLEEQNHLTGINEYIRETLNSIVELPYTRFEVERDQVHWTSATARAMLDHWVQNLNFQGPSSL